MSRVLHNLLFNAYKYTESGGRVAVTAAIARGLRLETRPDRGGRVGLEVRLSVADTGIGIAPEALSHIFERFYRADESRARDTGGTGIGLTIAKELVEAQGGRIEVESRQGRGSMFTVVLPVDGAGGEAR
ncbi:MAG: ATP-binding protein [Firmicutes bacterium]|nr:ATP-binding protein [Bacillota bacterium]